MHWTRRVGLLCLGLVTLGLTNVGLGQDSIAVNDGGVVYLDDFSGSAFLSSDGGNYLLFHKVVGEGVGHDVGFSRLGVRTRLWEDFDQHLFGELHALITDDSRVGFNVGGGYRKQVGGGILGAHAWFDDYEANSENRYRQITTGLEYLHPTFDIRMNGYIPIDEKENFIGIVNPGTNVSFLGNNLVTAGSVALERAFHGWDLEGGGPVPLAQNWLRAYAGVYQLLFDDDTTTGFRARAEARFMEGVNLNLVLSEDDKFGTNLNLGVEVRFRGTMPTRFQSGYTADRRYDQVRRVWPVQTHVDTIARAIPLNNPGTNDPIHIVWVDNTNPGGTGTFEDPFGMLPAGDANADLFLVNTGSGRTQGNITLLDGQQLLGAGVPHFVETDRLGVIQLPSEFNQVSGNLPRLEALDPLQPIVTLADNNVVRGFQLFGTDGIAGGNVDNFLIETIRSNDIVNGIVINNATGTGIVRDIDLQLMPAGTGIAIANSTPGTPLGLLVEDVNVIGGGVGVVVNANGGDVNYAIDGLDVTDTTIAGLGLVGTNAALNGTVINTILDGNLGSGAIIDVLDSTGITTFTGLESNGNGVDGLRVIAAGGSNYSVNVLDSNLNGNLDDNIDTDSVDMGSILNVFVDPTSLINAGDNSLEFEASGGGTLNVTFLDVTMTGATNDAINGTILTGGTANLDFANFDASGAGGDGLNVFLDGVSFLNGTFTNTAFPLSGSFSNSASSAVNIDANNGSVVNLGFTDITADNLAADGGVNLIANSGSQITSTWTGGSISNGLATGVSLDGDGAGTQISAVFNNVAITGNAGDGINAELTNGDAASILDLMLSNVTLTGNQNDGLDYAINGTDASGIILFNNVNLSGNLQDAFQFDVTGGAMLNASTAALSANDFSGSGSNAFQGTVDGANSLAIIQITDAPANGSGEEGALFNNDNGGTLVFSYTNGTLSGSGFDGLSTTTSNGSTTGILLDTVTLDGNGLAAMAPSGNGLVANVDANSTLNLTINDVSTSGNSEKGLSLTASNNSTINSATNTGFFVSTNNAEEGLFFDVNSGSFLSFNSVLGTTNFNGLSGNFSGVRGLVDGANSAASVSFDNFTSNFNTQDGYEFDVTNGGLLISEFLSTPGGLNPSTARFNTGAGIRLNMSGADSVAALVMEGNHDLSDNFDSNLIVNATSGAQLAIQAVGNFDSSFTGNGILINSSNVTNTAIEIGDGTSLSVSDNALGGIEINLENTTLDDIDVTTLTQTETVESLSIDNLTVQDNFGSGILITGIGATINDGSITNVNADFNFGDGIGLFFDNSTINGFNIENNGAQNNFGNGINVELTNMTVADGLNINNNTGAPQNLGIEFLIDGNVVANPFTITNISDPGLNISNIVWDLIPIGFNSPVFNTAGTASQLFTPLNNTQFFTGLNQVNGVNGPNFNMAVPDNSQTLSMSFNNFNPNEDFQFTVGLAPSQFSTGAVFGSSLIGSELIVDFANGAQVAGTMNAIIGNPDAAMFVANTTTQVETGLLNNGGEGLRIHVDNSTLSNSTISGNIAENNGSNGIEVLVENGSVIDMLNIASTRANNNVDEGVLFTLNDSTATQIVIDGSTVDDANGPNGIAFFANNSTADSITISNSVVQNSPNEGILFVGTNSALDNIIFDGNSILDSGADGLSVNLTNTAVAGTLAINNGSIENSLGNGLALNLDNSPIGRLEMNGNNAGTAFAGGIIDIDFTNLIWTTSIDNNSTPGLDIASFVVDLRGTPRVWRSDQTPFNNRFEVTGNSGVITGLASINGVPVNPATNPLQNPANNNAVLPEGGVPTGSRVVTFNFNDFQSGESFNYSLAHSLPNQGINGDITGAIGTVTLTDGRTASATALNSFGFTIFETFAQTFGGISSNAGSGIVLNALNGSNIGEIFIDNNLIQENGGAGMVFNVVDSTLPAVGSESVISNTSIGGSLGGGAFQMLNPDTNGTDFQLDFVDNDFTGNNGTGINIALNGQSGSMTSNMSGNIIDNNNGFGVRIAATQTAGINLTLGDSAGNANVITGHQDAGVGISLLGTGVSTLNVANTVISNTTNLMGSEPIFNGEGLAVLLSDMARLENSNIGDATLSNTVFTENAGAGVRISADLDSAIVDLTLQNFSSTFNGGDGVNIRRQGTAVVDNILINNINSSNNTGDGIDIAASLGDMTDEYVISNSLINENGGRGISLEARIDGDITAMISDTTITNNGSHGLSMTQVVGSLIDTPTVMVDVTGSTISMNNGAGINVQAVHTLTVDDTTISNNTSHGINIAALRVGPGSDSITNSFIIGNGNFETGIGNGINNQLGVDSIINMNTISNNADNGIAIRNGSHTINNNMIEMNGLVPNPNNDDGDGIQLVSAEGGNLTVSATGNIVRENRARGINLLVQGDTVADVTFNNGRVEGNQKEGVYVVTTTSLTRSVDQDANTANNDAGSLFANPILVFNFDNNDVLSNGLDSGFAGTGLVMRIGTSGSSTDPNAYQDDGGFVSDGLGNLTGRGGVLASITNSRFFANVGEDVLIESFNSTVAPVATVGNWDAANYDITTFQQDPLARLDLTFTGNTGDSADVVRAGASFANAEALFKSRTTAQAPAGPFDAGNRLRSGQRQAGRTGLFSDPAVNTIGTAGNSANFLYSGVGESTFRFTAGSNTNGFMSGDDFVDMLQLGANTGELPFTYDLIP